MDINKCTEIFYNRKYNLISIGYWQWNMVHFMSDLGDNWYLRDEIDDYVFIGYI